MSSPNESLFVSLPINTNPSGGNVFTSIKQLTNMRQLPIIGGIIFILIILFIIIYFLDKNSHWFLSFMLYTAAIMIPLVGYQIKSKLPNL